MRRELPTVVLLVLVIVAAAIKEPRFLGAESINSILLWIPLLAIVGMGQMLVIVTRGIDVSVGSIVGLAGMAAGMAFRDHAGLPLLAGLALGALVGLIAGAVNAAVIAWAKVPPIVATLGTLSAYRGLVFIASGGRQVDSNNLPDSVTKMALTGPLHLGGVVVPWILVLALVVAGITAFMVGRTGFGRDVFAMGSNPEAARLRGVATTRTTFLVYLLTGGLSGLAGVLYLSRYGFVNPSTAGAGMELTVIAAVVIGGTKVAGGSGSVLGVLLGCLLLGVMSTALAVIGVGETYQGLVYGATILVALLIDGSLGKVLSRARGAA